MIIILADTDEQTQRVLMTPTSQTQNRGRGKVGILFLPMHAVVVGVASRSGEAMVFL